MDTVRIFALCLLCLAGSVAIANDKVVNKVELIEVAQSERQWTGVAVSEKGRIFVNYPRWSDDVPVSVAELVDGEVRPFPNAKWNSWQPSASTRDHFVCVQSVYIDKKGYLWILDPANPKFQGVKKDGAKLLQVDLNDNTVKAKIYFDESVAPVNSYLNDVRVDTERNIAYITDSGTGAIVVVDLKTGKARRVLGTHPSTKAENIVLVIGGKKWLRDGKPPKIHADGIALDHSGDYLYYQALTSHSLYRIATKWLRDETMTKEQLGSKVQFLEKTGAVDGIIFGPYGNLYLSNLELDAIRRFTRQHKIEMVVQDSQRILWPDSFSVANDFVYFTTAQIHLGEQRTQPYRIFKFAIPK